MILKVLKKIFSKITDFTEQKLLFSIYEKYLLRYPLKICDKELKSLCNFPDNNKQFAKSWSSASHYIHFFDEIDYEELKESDSQNDVIKKADEILQNILYIMDNKKIDYGLRKVWDHDNVNDFKHLTKYYKKKIRYSGSVKPIDSLIPVKLNRHPFLYILGKAYLYSKNDKYADKAFYLINDWMNKNPVGIGLGWCDALNVSFRNISWIWTLELLKNSKAYNQYFSKIIGNLVFHARYIKKNLSFREFPNNHLVGEAFGLFLLALFLNPLKESKKYLEISKAILEREIIDQTYPDGGNKEHAFLYARLSADFFLQAYIIGTKNNIQFSQSYVDRLKKMFDFFLETLTPDFFMPSIGDSEDCMADRLSEVSKKNPIPLLATLSLLFKEEIVDFIEEMPEESFFLLGKDACNKFNKAKRTKKVFSSTLLPDTGLCIMRSGNLKNGLLLFFDVGPQGLGHSGHGHSDSLNIVVYAHGKNILVDPGTYIYNFNHDWRNYFKGTSAHNTIMVDRQDQAVPFSYAESFGWKEKADGHLSKWFAGKEYDCASGFHKGYMRLKEGILHNRSIFFNKKQGYWFILDTLEGKGEHLFELFYHLHPKMKIDKHQDNSFIATFDDGCGVKIILINPNDTKGEIIIGATDPIQGWFSSEYNSKEKSPVINYSKITSAPTYFMTIIQPFSNDSDKNNSIVNLRKFEDEEKKRIIIEFESGCKDEFIIPWIEEKRISFNGTNMEGELLFFSKDDKNKILDIFVMGNFLKKDDKILFNNTREKGFLEMLNFEG
jgi:hypothetical protein